MMTQGEQLASSLKRAPATYMEMLRWGISGCPWKRLAEYLDLPENKRVWQLEKGRRWVAGHEYLTTWRIVRKPRGVG